MTDTLQHYGVLGMKWGVRRQISRVGKLKEAAELYKEAKRYGDERGAALMRSIANDRIDAIAKNKKKIKQGQEVVDGILKKYGQETLDMYMNI